MWKNVSLLSCFVAYYFVVVCCSISFFFVLALLSTFRIRFFPLFRCCHYTLYFVYVLLFFFSLETIVIRICSSEAENFTHFYWCCCFARLLFCLSVFITFDREHRIKHALYCLLTIRPVYNIYKIYNIFIYICIMCVNAFVCRSGHVYNIKIKMWLWFSCTFLDHFRIVGCLFSFFFAECCFRQCIYMYIYLTHVQRSTKGRQS